MSASLFCGVLLDTQSDFQIVIERICDGVNISILAGVSLTLLVGDDGCVIYDMVYTNIHGQFVVAVFSGTIFENIRTINDRAVGIHTTLMRGVLLADMQNYDVPKLHITSGKKTLYMAGTFHIVKKIPLPEIHWFYVEGHCQSNSPASLRVFSASLKIWSWSSG